MTIGTEELVTEVGKPLLQLLKLHFGGRKDGVWTGDALFWDRALFRPSLQGGRSAPPKLECSGS